MPLFEYRCNKCGRKFEEIIRTEEDEFNLACPNPNCNSEGFEKLMSTTNFLKGACESKIPQQTETSDSATLSINGQQIEVDLVPATIHHPEGDIQAKAICPKTKKSKKEELN